MWPVAWETSKQKINRFLAQVATRKCHGLGSFNKRNSFLTAPEAEVWDQSASTGSSGESFLTGLQIAAFSPRPPKKEKVRKEGGNRGKEQALWHFFLRAHQSQHAGPSLTTSSRYSYLLKAPSPNTIMLGIRASTSEFFWEDMGVTKKKSADINR